MTPAKRAELAWKDIVQTKADPIEIIEKAIRDQLKDFISSRLERKPSPPIRPFVSQVFPDSL